MGKKLSLLLLVILLFSGCSTEQNNSINDENSQTTSTELEKSDDKTDTPSTQGEESRLSSQSGNSHSITASPSKTPPRIDDSNIHEKNEETTESSTKIIPSISYRQDGKTMYFSFNLKSNMEQMFTFHFDTSQQYDYTIKDDDGKVVRNYSTETNFPKLPSKHPVKPGGTITFEVPVENLPTGSYVINFVLTAKEMQPKAAIKFEVK